MSPFAKLISIAMLAIAAVSAFAGRPARPAVDGAALGGDYAGVLAATYADGWIVAADTLEKGGSVAVAQKALQDSWAASRVKSFRARVAPEFARVLAEGTEPEGPASRARVAALWRSFASGLRRAH